MRASRKPDNVVCEMGPKYWSTETAIPAEGLSAVVKSLISAFHSSDCTVMLHHLPCRWKGSSHTVVIHFECFGESTTGESEAVFSILNRSGIYLFAHSKFISAFAPFYEYVPIQYR